MEVRDARGRTVRVGPDCAISPPAEPAADDSRGRGGEEEAAPRGCPHEFFDAVDPGSARFSFPIWDANTILTEPLVIHMDRSLAPASEGLDCTGFAPAHVCYAGHSGTDFMLGGMWWAMDAGVVVRAAAAGVVTEAVDGNFDRCHADVDPLSPTFGGITCPDPEAESAAVTGANMVTLCHADGTFSRYAHLMNGSVQVQVGDRVECGDPLGMVGSSGRSAAPHLHFDLWTRGEDGDTAFVDPYSTDPDASRWVDQSGAQWGSLPATTCQT